MIGTTTAAVALHFHVAHTQRGLGGDLAHTFVHSAVSAFAWRGVGELFRSAHGLALVIVVVLVVAVGVYFLGRRSRP